MFVGNSALVCLVVRRMLGRHLLVADYGCTLWSQVRFLQRGVLVDSDDPLLRTQMLSDTVYNTSYDPHTSAYVAWPQTVAFSVANNGSITSVQSTGLPATGTLFKHYESVIENGMDANSTCLYSPVKPRSVYGLTTMSFGRCMNSAGSAGLAPARGLPISRQWKMIHDGLLQPVERIAQLVWTPLQAPWNTMIKLTNRATLVTLRAESLTECQRVCELTFDCVSVTHTPVTKTCVLGNSVSRETTLRGQLAFTVSRTRTFSEITELNPDLRLLVAHGMVNPYTNQRDQVTMSLIAAPVKSTLKYTTADGTEYHEICMFSDYQLFPHSAQYTAGIYVENSYPTTSESTESWVLTIKLFDSQVDLCAQTLADNDALPPVIDRDVVTISELCVPKLLPDQVYTAYADHRQSGHSSGRQHRLFNFGIAKCFDNLAKGFVDMASVRIDGNFPAIGTTKRVRPGTGLRVNFDCVERPSVLEKYNCLTTIPLALLPADSTWKSMQKHNLLHAATIMVQAIEAPYGSNSYQADLSTDDIAKLDANTDYVLVAVYTQPGTYMKMQLGSTIRPLSAKLTCATNVDSQHSGGTVSIPTLTDQEMYDISFGVANVTMLKFVYLNVTNAEYAATQADARGASRRLMHFPGSNNPGEIENVICSATLNGPEEVCRPFQAHIDDPDQYPLQHCRARWSSAEEAHQAVASDHHYSDHDMMAYLLIYYHPCKFGCGESNGCYYTRMNTDRRFAACGCLSNPTIAPTAAPTTAAPTVAPTGSPTHAPTQAPTLSPTASPTVQIRQAETITLFELGQNAGSQHSQLIVKKRGDEVIIGNGRDDQLLRVHVPQCSPQNYPSVCTHQNLEPSTPGTPIRISDEAANVGKFTTEHEWLLHASKCEALCTEQEGCTYSVLSKHAISGGSSSRRLHNLQPGYSPAYGEHGTCHTLHLGGTQSFNNCYNDNNEYLCNPHLQNCNAGSGGATGTVVAKTPTQAPHFCRQAALRQAQA